jgi:hypothetical protein
VRILTKSDLLENISFAEVGAIAKLKILGMLKAVPKI